VSRPSITDVKTILTAPEGVDLMVVKVQTSEPGLYGLGCATFTQRVLVVKNAVEQYLRPFLIGRDPQRIEDIWRSAWVSSYWRNGPVLNNALSGIDQALWDIKGKLAGMPVYQLLGGKCREGAAVYRHAGGRDPVEVEDAVRSHLEKGIRHLRCQLGFYGGGAPSVPPPEGSPPGAYFDPDAYSRSVPRLFEHLRERLGFEVELCHDVHERLAPGEAIRLAGRLEPYRLFFLEDPLPPEQLGWFRRLRDRSSVPLAMGELFCNPAEWMPLVTGRLIDFIRVHVSAIGGITPAWKLAGLCDAFGVRTAWHGPGDVSPVGQAANLHLDLSCPNFGIQECSGVSEALAEVFPGCPELRDGYLYPNGKPGLGVELDEGKAARYPCRNEPPRWTLARAPDGTSVPP
jgi:mannonate dehydratase